jgi:hypothetical protein
MAMGIALYQPSSNRQHDTNNSVQSWRDTVDTSVHGIWNSICACQVDSNAQWWNMVIVDSVDGIWMRRCLTFFSMPTQESSDLVRSHIWFPFCPVLFYYFFPVSVSVLPSCLLFPPFFGLTRHKRNLVVLLHRFHSRSTPQS